MKCLSDDQLLGYARGALASGDREGLERHLDACSRCLGAIGGLALGSDAAQPVWSPPLSARLLGTGALVGNRYAIRRLLGVGAMGEVYEAEDSLLGKTIALKTLNAVIAVDPSGLERLRSEVALAHRVTHPNVCRIYDIGVDHDRPVGSRGEPLRYLTMELLDGRTLAAYLREHGRLSFDRAREILLQLASALAAAHQVGVIHRDLKGDNVMLVEQPDRALRVVVTDFGLAGSMAPGGGRWTQERLAFSGLSYSAPEQLAGRPASAASDVYAFGLLAYQMLTGSGSLAALTDKGRLHDSFEAWTRGGETVPRAFWRGFLRWTLHPDARRRFSNGAALEAALLATRSTPSRTRRSSYAVAAAAGIAAAAWLVLRAQPEVLPSMPPVVVVAPSATAPLAVVPEAPRDEASADEAARPVAPPRPARRRARVEPPMPAGLAAAPAERAEGDGGDADDDIVRALPAPSRPLASEIDLADPFAGRRARAAGEGR